MAYWLRVGIIVDVREAKAHRVVVGPNYDCSCCYELCSSQANNRVIATTPNKANTW